MTIVGQHRSAQDSIDGILAVYPGAMVVLDVQLEESGSGLQVLGSSSRRA
jgi:hypothetical protein